MLLSDIVAAYLDDPPIGVIVEQPYVARALKDAVRFYCGFAKLTNGELAEDEIHDVIDADNDVDGIDNFDLTPSEYALIRPLFSLYVERESAMHLEASRGLGVDVFGRTVSEIAQDITVQEDALPRRAFMEKAETI